MPWVETSPIGIHATLERGDAKLEEFGVKSLRVVGPRHRRARERQVVVSAIIGDSLSVTQSGEFGRIQREIMSESPLLRWVG